MSDPTASQNIQNTINRMAWLRTTSILMPVISRLFLSQATKPLAANHRKEIQVPQIPVPVIEQAEYLLKLGKMQYH